MYIVRVYDCSISLLLHAPYAKYAYISKYMRYLAEMLPIRRTTKQAIRTIFLVLFVLKRFGETGHSQKNDTSSMRKYKIPIKTSK